MDKKIMICGSSGTGKTTLAEHMAELYELPYITTSASQVWERFGFKSHAGALAACLNDPDLGLQYQMAVLRNRDQLLIQEERYVTDRSFVDNAAYITLQLGHTLTQEHHEELLLGCRKGMEGIDGLIFLRWNKNIVLEDNGHRIMNRLYHEMVDNIMAWVIRSKIISCETLVLDMWDFETRIAKLDGWVKNL